MLDDECVDDLQINGLKIFQKTDGFKFGIDAVLLSDFAKDAPSKRTVDLCTGTGIIPLLLSAKTKTPYICGVEIQKDIADMAKRSVIYNKLGKRVEIIEADLKTFPQKYGKGSFDKVVCNPPYMKALTAVINQADTKTISRHEVMCTLDDVIKAAADLLLPKGRLFMVHRPQRLADVLCSMRKFHIEPKRLRMVAPSPSKAPNLMLVEGMYFGGEELRMLPELYIYNEDGSYSEEIDRIYGRII